MTFLFIFTDINIFFFFIFSVVLLLQKQHDKVSTACSFKRTQIRIRCMIEDGTPPLKRPLAAPLALWFEKFHDSECLMAPVDTRPMAVTVDTSSDERRRVPPRTDGDLSMETRLMGKQWRLMVETKAPYSVSSIHLHEDSGTIERA